MGMDTHLNMELYVLYLLFLISLLTNGSKALYLNGL